MKNLFIRLSKLASSEKRYWVPILFGVGTSIALLGVSLINVVGISTWAGWIDIAFGGALIFWGVIWSKYVSIGEISELSPNISQGQVEGNKIVEHRGFSHEVLPDKEGPYFLGDNVGFSIRITNLLDQPQTENFFFLIYLPDGMYLNRPLYSIDFNPKEGKVIKLGDPVFCAFLGIFRLVIVIGDAEDELIRVGKTSKPITFQTLFAGYSRDKEGFQLQKQMVSLTSWIRGLTIVLVGLTFVLIASGLYTLLRG